MAAEPSKEVSVYRPRKKKFVRRGAVAALTVFLAMTAIGVSSLFHRTETISAAVNSARAVLTQAAVAVHSQKASEPPAPIAKFHLVVSSGDDSSSGNTDN